MHSGGHRSGPDHDHDERRPQQQRDDGEREPGRPRVDHQVLPARTPARRSAPASRATGSSRVTARTRGEDSHRSGTDSPASFSR